MNSALGKLKIPGNFTFSGGQISMWVLFNIFEIAFFWKCFMCTFIRKVIYSVFLRSSYKTTAPKLTILIHDFLCCKIFEIAFFWKCFMCTFLRKVIYLVFLRFSYKTTTPKLTILTHDFLCCKGAEFGRLNWKCNRKTNLMQNYESMYIKWWVNKFCIKLVFPLHLTCKQRPLEARYS